MGKWTKYFVPVLALVFAFAVLSPVCCAEDWSDFGNQAHQTTHHKQDDQCRNLTSQAQALIKPSCAYLANSAWNITFYIPAPSSPLTSCLPEPLFTSSGLLNVDHTGPPLHLLNNVFLN